MRARWAPRGLGRGGGVAPGFPEPDGSNGALAATKTGVSAGEWMVESCTAKWYYRSYDHERSLDRTGVNQLKTTKGALS